MERLLEQGFRGEVSRNLVELALKIALEEALSTCLGIADVEVKVEPPGEVKAVCFFEVGRDITLHAAQRLDPYACHGDLIPRTMRMDDLPKKVVRRVKQRFPLVLEDLKTDGAYWLWKQRVHRAVEGVIAKVNSHAVWVDLGDQMGIMPRNHWISREVLDYRSGKVHWFYVLKVRREGRALRVYLSRNSISLPAALLKEMVPGVKARCIRRIAGARSWIIVDRKLDEKILAELGGKLGGEWIEAKHTAPEGKKVSETYLEL